MTTATAERPSVATVFADTMGHDLMAFILSTLRTMPDHWARMSQEQQEKRIAEMKESVTTIVQKCAGIVAGQGFQAVGCELEGVTIKDEVKIGLKMNEGDPARHALYDAKGRKVLLVLASAEQWLAKLDEIKSDKGQIDLLESDQTNYNPSRDQPGYRRDEDRVAPVGLTWAQLREKLNTDFPNKAEKDSPVEGTPPPGEPVPADLPELQGVIIVWPTGIRERLADYKIEVLPGETLVEALERAFPGCTFETPPADPLETLGANLTAPLPGIIQMRKPASGDTEAGPWGTHDAEEGQALEVEDDQTVRQALELLYPGNEFRFVPDGEARDNAETGQENAAQGASDAPGGAEDAPPATGADGQLLVYDSAALPPGSDPDAMDLLEKLTAIGMTINLQTVKLLTPEQRAHARRWLGDWSAAFEEGASLENLPARPHFLPLFAPPARASKPEAVAKKTRNRKH